MKAKLTLANGTILDVELDETQLTVETSDYPADGTKVYWLLGSGGVDPDTFRNGLKLPFDRGLIALDRESLERLDAQRVALTKLDRFIEKNGMELGDWSDGQEKFGFAYDHRQKKLTRVSTLYVQYNNLPWLKYEADRDRVLTECAAELDVIFGMA